MARKTRTPRVVEVEWLDAQKVTEQYKLSEAPAKVRLRRRRSVGWLVFQDRERILLAMTYDKPEPDEVEAQGDDFITIPRRWVRRARRVKHGRRA